MAITHPTAVRNAIADLVVDKLDLGTGTAAGRLVFQTAASATVATLPLSNPAAGAAASGQAVFNAITDDTNAVGGTLAKAEFRDRDATAIILVGVVAVSGGDINMTSLAVGAGDTVRVTSVTYVACP